MVLLWCAMERGQVVLRDGIWSCVRRSRGTAASTSSQPQAVMDSSADTSAPRLLAACGSGSWVPAFDLSADTSETRLLVGRKVGLRDGFRACVDGARALRHLPPHNRRRWDSSADASASRLLAACGLECWVPAFGLSVDTSAAQRLVACEGRARFRDSFLFS